ncbi:MAG: c-type cytochrome [Weeksellaceae bacterium]|nr:c-type cytochrome [Weeksellaceae bacterium]
MMRIKSIFPIALLMAFGVFYGFISHKTESGYEIEPNPRFKNLQVLPQDISEEDLGRVMDEFKYSLGVKCSFCHVRGDDGKMDWASDESKHKEIARDMMRMVMDINKNYFETENPAEFKVDCFSCHNGSKHPATTPPEAFEKPDAPTR